MQNSQISNILLFIPLHCITFVFIIKSRNKKFAQVCFQSMEWTKIFFTFIIILQVLKDSWWKFWHMLNEIIQRNA